MPEAESPSLMDLSERYRTLHDRIEAAAAKDGRTGSDVRLVAVTKFAADDQIRELLDLATAIWGKTGCKSWKPMRKRWPIGKSVTL